MTRRHGRRARLPFGVLLLALGIGVGILVYLIGRADDEAGAVGGPGASTSPTPRPRASS